MTFNNMSIMLPWFSNLIDEDRALLGDDCWPYGIQRNRSAIDVVLRYHHEQGLTKRLGEVLSVQGDFAGALKKYKAAQEIFYSLVNTNPKNPYWRIDFSMTYGPDRRHSLRPRQAGRSTRELPRRPCDRREPGCGRSPQ
jgi:hypothetical protein